MRNRRAIWEISVAVAQSAVNRWVTGSNPVSPAICWIGGMADALDLGSSVFDVRVQVPYPVPSLPFETSVNTDFGSFNYYWQEENEANTWICGD